MIAKKGDERVHHFAHFSGKQCNYGFETTLHRVVKDIIVKEKKILLPEVKYHDLLINEAGIFSFDDVVLERRSHNFIPDIVAYKNGKPLVIEITVTHEVNEEKKQKIIESGTSALEITINKEICGFSVQDLTGIILHPKCEAWVEKEKSKYVLRDGRLGSFHFKKEWIFKKAWLYNAKHAWVANNIKRFVSLITTLPTINEHRNIIINCPQGRKYADLCGCEGCPYFLFWDDNHDYRTHGSSHTIHCLGRAHIKSLDDLNSAMKGLTKK